MYLHEFYLPTHLPSIAHEVCTYKCMDITNHTNLDKLIVSYDVICYHKNI